MVETFGTLGRWRYTLTIFIQCGNHLGRLGKVCYLRLCGFTRLLGLYLKGFSRGMVDHLPQLVEGKLARNNVSPSILPVYDLSNVFRELQILLSIHAVVAAKALG